MTQRPHRVAVLGFADAQVLDITGPLEVFSRTARWLRDNGKAAGLVYEVELLAAEAGPLRTSGGLELMARPFRDAAAFDTLLVAGGIGWEAAADDAETLDWLRAMAPRVQRFGSI